MAPMAGFRRHVTAAAAQVVALPAPALVLGAIVSVQFGAAVAAGLIRALGPVLTVTIRLDVAAAILLAFARPSLRGRTRGDWVAVALLGVTLAAMNFAFYQAIARLPLGVVTTIEFLGPLGLAAAASRRPRDFLAVVVALAGVIAVSGALTASWDGLDPLGFAFTIAAAVGWAAYILCNRAVGQRWLQLDGLAVAMGAAALLVTPLGIASAHGVSSAAQLGAGVLIGILSSVVPYSLELLALRRIETRTFGILLSLEPAVAALAGLLVLGQTLAVSQVLGMALVVLASAMVMAAHRGAPEEQAAEIG
jgi:inner membrane transporter RhtA